MPLRGMKSNYAWMVIGICLIYCLFLIYGHIFQLPPCAYLLHSCYVLTVAIISYIFTFWTIKWANYSYTVSYYLPISNFKAWLVLEGFKVQTWQLCTSGGLIYYFYMLHIYVLRAHLDYACIIVKKEISFLSQLKGLTCAKDDYIYAWCPNTGQYLIYFRGYRDDLKKNINCLWKMSSLTIMHYVFSRICPGGIFVPRG